MMRFAGIKTAVGAVVFASVLTVPTLSPQASAQPLDTESVLTYPSALARLVGMTDVSEKNKTRALRDLGFDRDERCYFVKRTASSAKWVGVGFTDYAVGRYAKCRPFDAWIIAVKERGKYNRVVDDNLRNSCRRFELDLFRAGASVGVVRDLRAAKGC